MPKKKDFCINLENVDIQPILIHGNMNPPSDLLTLLLLNCCAARSTRGTQRKAEKIPVHGGFKITAA